MRAINGHAHLEATEDIKIAAATAALTRRVPLELSARARAKDRAARALGVLRSFIKVHVPLGSGAGSLVIDFEPQPGQADSGQLDADLSGLFTEVGETAQDSGTGVLLTIDEIQYLGRKELSALIIGLHRVSQLSLPLLVAGAGLPSLPGLAGEARSYAERLFRYVDIGSLGHSDASQALTLPAEQEGAGWSTDAVERVIHDTQGYPNLLQEFGKQAWNLATGPHITLADVEAATMLAID